VGGSVGGLPEDAAKKAAGRIERTRDAASGPGLDAGAVAIAAPIAVEFKLEAVIGAVIVIIAGKLDFFHLILLLARRRSGDYSTCAAW
jgi:hypothetical protein